MLGNPYLVAQLPSLSFEAEEKDLPRREKFLELASEQLSKSDYDELRKADIGRYDAKGLKNPVLKEFAQFERALRADLAHYRRAQKEEFEYKPSVFPLSLVKDADPLEVEVRLMKFRWDFLTENEFGHHFDLGIVAIFYLKLQLLYRKASFVRERGWDAFSRICAGKEKA